MPRRDTDGRVISLTELLGTAAVYAVVNGLGLLLIDGILAVVHLSSFGSTSGWLALVLPALLYLDDFRAWRAHRLRWLVGPVAAVLGIALGVVLIGVAPALPSLASGAIGAAMALVVYAPVWFLGIRRLTGDWPASDRESRR
jgi:hypothetical protein